jgi:hypothetical protein
MMVNPVVVDDLNFVSAAFLKFETDTPAFVDRHGPLSPAIPFELGGGGVRT